MKKISKIFHNTTFLRIIFWGYNILGLLFTMFISIPIAFTSTLFRGSLPWDTILIVYILLFIPLGSILLAIFTKIGKDPKKLASFFFAVEMPLFFISFFRVIFVRQMTPIYWLFFISALLVVTIYTILLFKENFNNLYKKIAAFLSFESAIILVCYFSLLLVFFFPPLFTLIGRLLYDFFSEAGEIIVMSGGFIVIHILLGLFLLILFFGLFIITPIVGVILFYNAFKKAALDLKESLKKKNVRILGYSFAALYIIAAVLLSWQPGDTGYLEKYNQIKESGTFEEQQEIVKSLNSEKIKESLKNSFLSKYRYIADKEINILFQGYKNTVKVPENISYNIQKVWNFLASPFIYRGSFNYDSEKATEIYKDFFDAEIMDAEKNDILSAYESTHTNDDLLRAGLLDKDEEAVRVVSRKIYAEDSLDGLVTKVSFKEEYLNLTNDLQEVYYKFTLPENAVITGLWLGPDLELEGEISPRGAASKTYENQYTVKRDPALLEQLGPRQYRLKVYPIPSKDPDSRILRDLETRGIDENETQKVKFEYVVMNTKEGIPLPEFTEKRNVFTDEETDFSYIIDGEEVYNEENSTYLAASKDYSCAAAAYTAPTSVGSVMFIPHNINLSVQYLQNNYNCIERNIGGDIEKLKIALLLDTSYSNQVDDWSKYLKEEFDIEKLMENNQIDLYFFNDKLSKKIILTPELLDRGIDVKNFGKTDRSKAFLNLLSIPDGYNLALMITDDSNFEVKNEENVYFNPKMPLYAVHRTGKIPEYTDLFTEIVYKTGGGVFTDPLDALEDYWMSLLVAMNQSPIPDYSIIDVDDYGTWFYSPTSTITLSTVYDIKPLSNETFFAKLMNKKITNYYLGIKDLKNNEELDEIHAIAADASIVTPYSSFIALENDAQKEELNNAEGSENRYDLNTEKVESLLNPPGMGVLEIGGVPEPEEWALIIMSILLLFYFYRRNIYKWIKSRI